MNSKIELRGIERQWSVSNGADGGMERLVGWRMRDGNMRVRADLVATGVALGAQEELLYVHSYGDYDHYVIYGDGVLIVRDGDGNELLRDVISSVTQVCNIGNILVVLTGDGMREYLFRDGGYRNVTRGMMPYIGVVWEEARDEEDGQVVFESDRIDIVPDDMLGDFGALVGGPYPYHIKNKIIARQLTDQMQGLLSNYRLNASMQNVLVDSYLVRYGYRMYDGNYIYVSEPILLKNDAYDMVVESAKWDAANGWEILQGAKIEGLGHTLKMDVRHIDVEDTLMSSSIITAVDVFLSLPIPNYDSDRLIDAVLSASQTGGDNSSIAYYKMTLGSMQEARNNDIEKYFNYYRVASYTIDELKKIKVDGGIVDVVVNDKIDTIEQQPLLEEDDSVHSYTGGTSYVYNGRLHIGDVREKLFAGNGLHYHGYSDSVDEVEEGDEEFTLDSYVVLTYIRHDREEYVVRSEEIHDINILSTYISYPDTRAYRIDILAMIDGLYYRRELLLKQHPYMNASYYFDGWQSSRLVIDRMDDEITESEYIDLLSQDVRDIVERPNIIKVSELHNPMVYPNDKTYTVGSGRIVSMAVATKAISEGQFGQYPMYVFTDEGIWAMHGGDGQVVYSQIAPVSRDVVTNEYSVCGIDEAVVYGTSQGLYILQGGNRICITTGLDEQGVLRTGDRSLSSVVRQLTGIEGDDVLLSDMLSRGRVAYHYHGGEILLYIPGRRYVYAYSLLTGMWGVYDETVSYTVGHYPDLLLMRRRDAYSDEVCRIDEGGTEICEEQLMVTRGISLGSMDAKRITRIHMPSYFGGDKENTMITVGVAVSNDGESWALAWSRQLYVGSLHNVTLPHVSSAYRYFSLIVHTKGVTRESYVNSISVEWDVKRVER